MRHLLVNVFLGLGASACLHAGQPPLTIYNQDFAVVRDLIPLSLKSGLNQIEYAGVTANAEPESVILRDPTGKIRLQILEQNYRRGAVSLDRMLELFDGKTIQFQRPDGTTIPGRIIRPQTRAGQQTTFYNPPIATEFLQSMIEVDGQVRFDLPGTPLFPKDADHLLLKPAMNWTIRSDRQATLDAELGYVTSGLNWKADYNVISSETDDRVDVLGWITMVNRTGKSFSEAQIALMAGDVNKLTQNAYRIGGDAIGGVLGGIPNQQPVVTEKPFDDYHLYKLANKTTLLDAETKQVEFVRANGVPTKRLYVYDGADLSHYQNMYMSIDQVRNTAEYGSEINTKVWAMREFTNSAANSLGMPLPKGRLRFYRQDGPQIEFTGENQIDHTPKDETIRVLTGNAFDIVGSRKQTSFYSDLNRREIDESLEVIVRNRKSIPVAVAVCEHMYRGTNWKISNETDIHVQADSKTIEFPISIPANSEKTVRYSVHYTW